MGKQLSIDSITIQKAIVHFLDLNTTEPTLATRATAMDDDIDEYLKAHIEKAYNSDDIKKSEFEREGYISKALTDIRHNFIEVSQEVARRFFGVMQDAGTIPSADLIELLADIDGEEYFCVLKLNYKTSFVHEFRQIADTDSINIVKHNGILPGKTSKLDEAFLINIDTREIMLLEKKYEINGVKDYYISSVILGCTDTISPKGQVEMVRKVAEKLYKEHYGDTVDAAPRVAEVFYKELNAQDTFRMSNIYDNYNEAFPEVGAELREVLSNTRINTEEAQPVPISSYKKIAKQVLRSSTGVEIKIPTKVYSNQNALEFIHHADGSISLIIHDIVHGDGKGDED